MDLMIAFVTIGVIGYAFYYVFTEQDGGSCWAAQSFKEARAAAGAPASPVASAPAAVVAASAAPAVAVQRQAAPPAAATPAPSVAAAATPAAPAAPVPMPQAPAAARRPVAGSAAEAVLLRDPQTGETASVPSNYRFAKKWVKEALVAEGLLDKVYKNNELDESANEKIKAALEQLKTLAKYHA